MNLISLLRKYPKIDIDVLKGYELPDKELRVNINDRDLIPIVIKLPQPPDYHLIDGFGLPAREQKWHPPKMPKRLRELENDPQFQTIDELWNYLDDNQEFYQEEIEFIRTQWDRRFNGYWFFNNGKPTYIDGWHYFYCGWWKIDIGLPHYRDRDRKFFLFARFCYTDTRDFKHKGEKGVALKVNGLFKFIDLLRRICFGFNYPKHRREGATYKAECINYEIISRNNQYWGGIQSMNDESARKCFRKFLVSPWKKLPFFFKPNYEGSTDPKAELSFNSPATRLSSRGSLIRSDVGLESVINYEVADKSAYDGDKLHFHHDDEVGKLQNVSCWDRHLVVKECLSEGHGNLIHGFTIKTSTVGEMLKGGGAIFKKQCLASNFYQRNPNGQTVSGLYTIFIPAYEGLEGFIDEYGNSVIDTPTEEQAAYINNKIGAKQYIENERQGFRDIGDFEGLSEKIRQYPIRFAECFRPTAKSSGFNLELIETRLDELLHNKGGIIRGNFRWIDNVRDSRVEFVESPTGKFFVSHQLNDDESNLKYYDDHLESWVPQNTSWGIAGGDPFKFNKTETNRKSNGAGAVLRKRRIELTSQRGMQYKRNFVCTYSYRPYDKNIYAEDMLMMCVYYGVKMFPEINVSLIWDYFEERGYGEFLQYRIDPKTFQAKKTPGDSSLEKVKQDIFTEWMTFINNDIFDEVHAEMLEECRDIDGPEDMTNYDRFTAGGYALIGSIPIYDDMQKMNEEDAEIDQYVHERVYK